MSKKVAPAYVVFDNEGNDCETAKTEAEAIKVAKDMLDGSGTETVTYIAKVVKTAKLGVEVSNA
jgi:hypothetical protein